MQELIDKKRTEAKVFLIARLFIDRPDREVELVKAVIHRCCEEIDKQPTIEAEPVRHGRWIKEYQYLYGGEQWVNQYCSLCEMHTRQRIRDGFYKFCPACGARMDGGADNG